MFKTKGLSNLDILVLKSVEKYGEILITECESKRSFLEETLGCGNIKFTMTTEVKSCTNSRYYGSTVHCSRL